jgi:hypothetical protein
MAKTDPNTRAADATGPVERIYPVTPDDAADLPDGVSRSLFVGGAGAVAIVDRYGNEATLISGPSQYHPIRVRRVRAAGTTATDIIALY